MSKKKTYNQDKIDRAANLAQMLWGWRADAAPSLFLQRELQDIEAIAYETPTKPLLADTLIPINQVNPGAMEGGYDRITRYGSMRWVAANAQDLPRVNAAKVRTTFQMRSAALMVAYNQDEIRSAQMAGVSLDAEHMTTARRAGDQFRDRIAISGDSAIGLTGFVNDANVPRGNATNGSWASATPEHILQDMNDAWIDAMLQNKTAFPPDTLALPFSLWALIASTPRSSTDPTTILETFLKNQPYIKSVIGVLDLEDAGSGSTGRMVVYQRSKAVLQQSVAIAFEPLAPQFVGLEVQIPCVTRIGGTQWKAPIAAVYRDGL